WTGFSEASSLRLLYAWQPPRVGSIREPASRRNRRRIRGRISPRIVALPDSAAAGSRPGAGRSVARAAVAVLLLVILRYKPAGLIPEKLARLPIPPSGTETHQPTA